MAISSISRAFDYKLLEVTNTSTIPSGTTDFTKTLTSTNFTNAIADGYVPVALAGFYTGSHLWYVNYFVLSTSDVTMAVTRRDSQTSSAASMTLKATVMMVKSI